MDASPSPTARALMVLELLAEGRAVGAERLSRRLGVSERAVRRYVAILREAGVPVESERGPYGGYRLGRGVRLPPLTFSTPEALGLVMAVIEAHGAVDPERTDDPVVTAVGKLARALPEGVAGPLHAVRAVSARRTDPDPPAPETTLALVEACADRRRVHLTYERGGGRTREMDVDPWAVVVRHGRWYVLGWSHTLDARRVLRVDRIRSVERLATPFLPPEDLDPMRDLEDQLSMNWPLATEVEIDAPVSHVRSWLPRSLGRLEEIEPASPGGTPRTRLVGSTEVPDWYAGRLAALEAPFRVLGGPELVEALARLLDRLHDAVPGATPAGS